MAVRAEIYDRLAGLFRYPGIAYAAEAEQCRGALKEDYPEAEAAMARFAAWLSGCSGSEVEEEFGRTFDLNPACCAEIGWHLFGERYDRGSFLVWLRSRLREVGVEEEGELPDHLVHVLPLLGRLEYEEAKRLAGQALQPAVKKMASCLGDKNSFRLLIEAMDHIVAADFGPGEAGPGEATSTSESTKAEPAETSGEAL